MKEEVLPEIPIEQTPSTNSMYEMLKKTSQKWFQRTHKPIFQQSTLQRSTTSIHLPTSSITSPPPQPTTDKQRLARLMREQIDIVCQQYNIKTKNVLQQQSKKIKMLGQLLNHNQLELKKKDKIIAHLQQNITQMKINSNGKNLQQSELKGIASKIKEIEQKLGDVESIANTSRTVPKLDKINTQIQRSIVSLSDTYLNRLQTIHQDLQDRIDRIDKMSHLNQSLKTSIRSPSHNSQEIYQLQKRIKNIEIELEDIKDQTASFRDKQYSYQNYKIEHLQTKLNKIHHHLSQLQRASRSKSKEGVRSSYHVNLKGSQTTQLTSTAHIFNHSKSRFVNKYKSMITQRKQKESGFSSQNYSSSSQSEVESTVLEDQENNVTRFIRVVETTQKLPILIEIDPTGYVRSVESGMYIYDPTGNAFELTQAELTQLLLKKIIKL